MARVWLITGCSKGFGKLLAKEAVSRGDKVFATARSRSSLSDLEAIGCSVAGLDVTDEASIVSAVAACESQLGPIDVLVNNAGYGSFGAFEDVPMDRVRQMFETNFFGLVAVTRTVLPSMRARKSGWIVNLSSIAGLYGFKTSGFYSATKHAVEAVSESLSQEVEPFGIRVLLVEPGAFRTDFFGGSFEHTPVSRAYEPHLGELLRSIVEWDGEQPGDPAKAMRALCDTLDLPHPPLRLLLGADAWQTAQNKLASVQRDFAAHAKTTLSMDFD